MSERIEMSLTVRERLVLRLALSAAPRQSRAGVLTIQELQRRLMLSEDEREAIGYVEEGERARWDEDAPEYEFVFTPAEAMFVGQSREWDGWLVTSDDGPLWVRMEAAIGANGRPG